MMMNLTSDVSFLETFLDICYFARTGEKIPAMHDVSSINVDLALGLDYLSNLPQGHEFSGYKPQELWTAIGIVSRKKTLKEVGVSDIHQILKTKPLQEANVKPSRLVGFITEHYPYINYYQVIDDKLTIPPYSEYSSIDDASDDLKAIMDQHPDSFTEVKLGQFIGKPVVIIGEYI